MDTQPLVAIGLTPLQAEAYALLIELGELKPTETAKRLSATRTNAYKVLDRLVEMDLAKKVERGKKFVYVATNPLALATLTEKFRAEATAREEAVSGMLQDLLAQYYTHTDRPQAEVFTGRKAVADAYRRQLSTREDIYFIHTKADVPMMGFDTMHEIRTTPAKHGLRRHGLLATKVQDTKINFESHRRSHLDITWHRAEDYTAPVEWSVTSTSLLIVLYATEPHAILITDKVVAGAFLQLWKMLRMLLAHQVPQKRPEDA